MSTARHLRTYGYVNRSYERVRPLLRERGLAVLQRATRSAAARADELAATLRVDVAGIEVGIDVHIHMHGVRDEPWIAGLAPVTRVKLNWEAARRSGLFPSMEAELSAWPLSGSETQLELQGDYTPPLGALGNAIDAAILHRVAEAAVHRFLEEVIDQIKHELPDR